MRQDIFSSKNIFASSLFCITMATSSQDYFALFNGTTLYFFVYFEPSLQNYFFYIVFDVFSVALQNKSTADFAFLELKKQTFLQVLVLYISFRRYRI
jgi:hypothetical protein